MTGRMNPDKDQVEVLVVEDSPTQADQLRYLLEQHGYTVTVARDGMQALALLDGHEPSLVISDIVMPEMDGYELCKRIKSDESTNGIPVILLTSLSNSEDVLNGLVAGADNFLTKPYSEEYLLSSIEQILANRKLRKSERVRVGVEIVFAGKCRFITADQQQMLTLLISTYEAAVHRNNELVKAQKELNALNERLEELVEERTAALTEEIAERERMEEATRVLAKFPSENPDPVMRISIDGTLLYINENGSRHLSEWHLQAGKIVPPVLRDAVSRAMNHGSRQVFELESNERVYSFTVAPISDAGYANLYGRDITERKLAKKALRDNEEHLNELAEQARIFFWEVDKEGLYTYVSSSSQVVLGFTPEEVVGKKHFYDLHPDAGREAFREGAFEVFSRKDSFRDFENAVQKMDGLLAWVSTTGNPVVDANGTLLGYRGSDVDITERKLAEEEKLSLERQVQVAQKMEAVGTLAGGIAHDFNNSLTGIVGFGELLRMRMAGDEKAVHDLDEILRCAERAATLTRQLLTFARRQVIEPVNLNLNDLVADLMKLIGKVVGEHIEVKTYLGKNVPTIHADRGQIEQVAMNLCLNSRDAMPKGGQLVVETGDVYLDEEHVRQYPYMKTGRYALLTVSDTGVGMDEKTRARVFEPFFTTKGPDKGTGLGLSMVYGIVKQHGGFILVDSEPGKGTASKVYFPAIEAQPDAIPEIRKEEIVRGGTETVLLAEDEEAIRALAERILTGFGYKVLVARNGEEAVELFRREQEIALAVLDVVMPRKGGKEAFEEMHRQNPRLKVIFMSGYSADAIHDSFVLTPGTPFLQKPFGPTILTRKVREALDGK